MAISSDPFSERMIFRQKNQPEIMAEESINPDQNQQIDPFSQRLKERGSQYQRDSDLIWEDAGDFERQEERGRAQGTSRLLESTLGTPGNIQSLIKEITGLQVGTQLPTSEDIKEFSEKATLGYTKPQNEFEKKAGEIVSDIGAMALPGSTSYSILRNVGIPITGFLAKEGLESLGASEYGGNAAKIATMVGLDLLTAYKNKGRGGAKNYAKELWKEGEANIPKGVSLKSENLVKDLTNLKQNLEKGGSSPSTTAALKKIEEILETSKDGKIGVDDLIAFRKKINELVEARGGFEYGTNQKIVDNAVLNLNQVKNKIIEQLDEYGKINPEFGQPYKQANEVYSAYHASNYIANFLTKKFANYLKTPALHYLFSGLTGAGTTVAAASGLSIPYQGLKILSRVWKSPTLAKLYGGVLKGALKNNVNETAKNLEGLKKGLQEEESSPSKK